MSSVERRGNHLSRISQKVLAAGAIGAFVLGGSITTYSMADLWKLDSSLEKQYHTATGVELRSAEKEIAIFERVVVDDAKNQAAVDENSTSPTTITIDPEVRGRYLDAVGLIAQNDQNLEKIRSARTDRVSRDVRLLISGLAISIGGMIVHGEKNLRSKKVNK
jgi:hypothetical protein